MLDLETHLTEFCREHHIDIEMLRHCEDLDDLVGRALNECERRLETDEPAARQQLRDWVRLARQAHLANRKVVMAGNLQATGIALGRETERLEQARRQVETIESNLQHAASPVAGELDGRTRSGLDPQKLMDCFQEIGRLCHKINNPLTSIMGRAQILQMKLAREPASPNIKAVNVISDSSKRVAVYVQELAHVLAGARDHVKTALPDAQSSSTSSEPE